jgi:hypothetical protein
MDNSHCGNHIICDKCLCYLLNLVWISKALDIFHLKYLDYNIDSNIGSFCCFWITSLVRIPKKFISNNLFYILDLLEIYPILQKINII